MAKTYDQHLHDSLAYLGLPALASHSAWTPNTDVYETPEGLVVKMEIAGIEKEDLEITLNDRLLLVRMLLNHDPGILTDYTARSLIVTPMAFIVGWAVALVAVAAWAVKAGRRWVVNLAAVFGTIHFYTQWFERLGATPGSVLIGGVLVLAFAVAAWKLNQKFEVAPAAA